MKSILPIFLIILALTGAIVYSLAKRTISVKPINNVGISANQLAVNTITPTPSIKSTGFGNSIATPTIVIPTVVEKIAAKPAANTVTTTTTSTICTPVYGSADTCTEHVVVNTGADDAIFFNFAGLAYLGGLVSFVKAKSLKK
jgi:hypothetical protein